MAKVLVIDDEENIRKTLKEILEDESHEVLLAEEGQHGFALFKDERPDVVLLDMQLPGKDGLTLLKEIKDLKIDCEIIIITGHGTIESAIKAIKLGAYHFLQKPLSMVEVRQNVRHAAEAKLQRDELNLLRSNHDDKYRIIGESKSIENIKQQILKVAPTPGRVLITGESGTGKELVAYAIHKNSPRAGAPFVKINCAAIPQNLIESELFGHEKGSFTGAFTQKKGKFELAHKGTIFLDEIGDMDLNTQTKVLRVIQEGECERVGGTKTVQIDVRVIAATHRNLQDMIATGTFREDLFYRLNVIPMHVPSLSERVDDVPVLASYFLEEYCKDAGNVVKRFSADALVLLSSKKYPGNIRELKNIVERAAIMSDSQEISGPFIESMLEIKKENGADLFTRPRLLSDAKNELERIYVKTQLELNDWNIVKTAGVLGIERTNLHRKIKQLDIEKR